MRIRIIRTVLLNIMKCASFPKIWINAVEFIIDILEMSMQIFRLVFKFITYLALRTG
jgi:hypothetical protein